MARQASWKSNKVIILKIRIPYTRSKNLVAWILCKKILNKGIFIRIIFTQGLFFLSSPAQSIINHFRTFVQGFIENDYYQAMA